MKAKSILRIFFLVVCSAVLLGAGFESSPPKKLSRSGDKWKDGGRILGELSGLSEKVSMQVIDAKTGVTTCKFDVLSGMTVYFSPFLKTGDYELVIKAEGIPDCKVNKIQVSKGADTLVNLKLVK